MIDFHCHLDLYPETHEIVAQCVQRRLYVLSVTTVPSAFEETAALSPGGGRIRTALADRGGADFVSVGDSVAIPIHSN